jgi:hypothetical protein
MTATRGAEKDRRLKTRWRLCAVAGTVITKAPQPDERGTQEAT